MTFCRWWPHASNNRLVPSDRPFTRVIGSPETQNCGTENKCLYDFLCAFAPLRAIVCFDHRKKTENHAKAQRKRAEQ
jgi:hypothetical protein